MAPTTTKKKTVFRVAGLCIIAVWLGMIGLLVKRVHFPESPVKAGLTDGQICIEGEEREWKEIYLRDRKVGYAVSLIGANEQGYLVQEELFLKLHLLGLGQSLYLTTHARLDPSLRLKEFRMMMTSGIVRFEVSGRVEDGALVLTDPRQGGHRVQKIAFQEAPMMAVSLPLFFRTRPFAPGEVFRFPIFDPTTLSQKGMGIKVAGKETLILNRIAYETYRLEGELWGKPLTFWVDEKGRTLKEEGFMGLTTLRSSASMASRGLEGGEGDDLYEMFAVRADRLIGNPQNLAYLKLKLEGIDWSNPHLNHARQRMGGGLLEITKESLPSGNLPCLPFDQVPEDVKTFLAPEFNVESDDPRVVSAARQITGAASDPLSTAGKLLQWVHQNIEKRPVLSMPSALEVLSTRVGDCNEHAVLLAALLRASGIPARLCIGLVYSRDKFYYHAWNEAWLGEWISMDPILNQMPVDATHIKWIEGNLSRQVEIVRVLDTLKIQVMDFRHD